MEKKLFRKRKKKERKKACTRNEHISLDRIRSFRIFLEYSFATGAMKSLRPFLFK